MTTRFKGMFPALPTPFDDDGAIREAALRGVIDHNVAQGMHGLYVGGSTSEAFLLPTAERERLLEIVADQMDGRLPLIAHVGFISTDETVSLARRAEALGYDAISFIQPYYYQFSAAELRDHTMRIGHAVDVPVILYNIPGNSGVQLGLDVLLELLSLDCVAGMKHTSYDFYVLERVKSALPDKAFFVGNDEVLAGGLAMGGDGGIGSSYSVLGPRILGVYECIKSGDFPSALAHQRAVNTLIFKMHKAGYMQALKALLSDLGLEGGHCRRPFRPLPDDQFADVREAFKVHFGALTGTGPESVRA